MVVHVVKTHQIRWRHTDDQAEAALRARHINTFPMSRLNVKDWTDGETGVRLSRPTPTSIVSNAGCGDAHWTRSEPRWLGAHGRGACLAHSNRFGCDFRRWSIVHTAPYRNGNRPLSKPPSSCSTSASATRGACRSIGSCAPRSRCRTRWSTPASTCSSRTWTWSGRTTRSQSCCRIPSKATS